MDRSNQRMAGDQLMEEKGAGCINGHLGRENEVKRALTFDLGCIPEGAVITSMTLVDCKPTGEVQSSLSDQEYDDEDEYW